VHAWVPTSDIERAQVHVGGEPEFVRDVEDAVVPTGGALNDGAAAGNGDGDVASEIEVASRGSVLARDEVCQRVGGAREQVDGGAAERVRLLDGRAQAAVTRRRQTNAVAGVLVRRVCGAVGGEGRRDGAGCRPRDSDCNAKCRRRKEE